MDTLKTITILSAVLFIFSTLPAQEKLIETFGQSYQMETNGKYKEAAELIKTVYDEDNYEINLRLGWLSYLSGQFTESIAYYNNAINTRPMGIEARLGLVLPHSAIGNWNQIIEQYELILKIDPQNTVVNYRMAAIHYERKLFEKAESYVKRVINLYPFDHDSILLLGWIKFRQGNFTEAKILFNKALLYNPADQSAKEGLSLIN